MKSLESLFAERKVIDSHVHIFPPRVFDAIWRYFETNYWPINYKLYADQVAEELKKLGIRAFTTLNYAHKPGMARELNKFTFQFAQSYSEAIPMGTLHPGDKNVREVAEEALTSYGFKGFKLQIMVTDFHLDDERLDPVYKVIVQEDGILTLHIGNGPLSTPYVGFAHFKRFLAKYPALRIQIAHLGCFEHEKFFALIPEYPRLYFDTAMIYVNHTYFPSYLDLEPLFFIEFQDQIMFGSDFPNIPYEYEQSYREFIKLDLPPKVFNKIFHQNAQTLYGI